MAGTLDELIKKRSGRRPGIDRCMQKSSGEFNALRFHRPVLPEAIHSFDEGRGGDSIRRSFFALSRGRDLRWNGRSRGHRQILRAIGRPRPSLVDLDLSLEPRL